MGVILSKLIRVLFAKKKMKLLMVGLPGSGKNTILDKLKLGKPQVSEISGLKVSTIVYRNVTITVFDVVVPDKESLRWKKCLEGAQGLIFVLDSNAKEKIPEAKTVLDLMLSQEELRDATLLVLANKEDTAGAMGAYDVAEKLGLKSLRGRRWYIQSSDAKTGLGIYEGLDWLSNNISSKA